MPTCPKCGADCGSEAWAMKHCTPWRIAQRTGYRHDGDRHAEARLKVPARRRRQIAKLGGAAFAAAYGKAEES